MRHAGAILMAAQTSFSCGFSPVIDEDRVCHQRLAYVWYPSFMGLAIGAFATMRAADLPLAVSLYAPVALIGLVSVLLPVWFPERPDWRPSRADVKVDAAFLALVQVLLPKALAVLAALSLAGWAHAAAPSVWWPHSWPLAAQIGVMVLVVDFLRYWLHRACHRYGFLWRLHEVHHSPEVLYALNTGRFHPAEKLLHFCADTVPFLLLGVAPEVLAGYFLVYAANGFFQHSNIRLRYGWLNAVVGSAETHRWHHARDLRVAACNYGSTTMVWDRLFGTWYLPAKRTVEAIGIPDSNYPKGFWAQVRAPFATGAAAPRRKGGKAVLVDALVSLHARIVRLVEGRRIAAAVRDPMRVQRRLLARILRENRDTTFGRRHGFRRIACYREFAARVPVSDYEALRPLIDGEIGRGEHALTAEPPVGYARTSGTTGRAKDIPLTRSHLKALQRIHHTAVAFQHRAYPEAFAGSILAIVSPAREGLLPNGKPYGSASGMVAASTPGLVREKFVIPAAVLTVSDCRVKYLLILRLALARRDVTYLGTANAATLLALIKLYREEARRLIDDLRSGEFFLADRLAPAVRASIGDRLAPDPERAAELAGLCERGAAARIADLWPELRLVTTWTGGSAGITVEALRRELGPRTRIHELGYAASEFRGTITLGRNRRTGLPTLDTHFFEFVERDRWDRGEPEFLTLDAIRRGIDYYIFVTTPSGLYRYFMNDLVRVTGFLHRTPLLGFVQKGKGVTSITGEKLYEAQALEAVRDALAEFGRATAFVMMLADETARTYRLYVEPDAGPRPPADRLAQRVDAKLMTINLEYASKRASGRLDAPAAAWLAAGAGEAHKAFCVRQGQREAQFKIVALAYRKDFAFDLEALVERD
jgi:sterol desaturase/sphingolipid hydroxylase (fatty acid hydroxylase superfamily)